MKSYPLIKKLEMGEDIPMSDVMASFESYRSEYPVVYNIETTNACNMRCRMCPRTTRMDRKITFLENDFYDNVINQLKPHSEELWKEWEDFCVKTYGIGPDAEPSENHFFLHIIPRVIQLHGYGDPLLDKNLGNVIKKLSENGLESYFSCNPANIDVEKTIEMMASGLTYLKYSFESTDDEEFKQIRGNAANFTEAYKKTIEIIETKESLGYDTIIVITMIDVNKEDQKEEFQRLRDVFMEKDVYIYLKSEDQQWYREDETLKTYLEERNRVIPTGDYHGTKAIHWQEVCKHPWMSMTVKSDGFITMCMEDYNNEIILGDANNNSLYDIWNGDEYKKFRSDQFNLTPCIKCTEECDMPLMGKFYINENDEEVYGTQKCL